MKVLGRSQIGPGRRRAGQKERVGRSVLRIPGYVAIPAGDAQPFAMRWAVLASILVCACSSGHAPTEGNPSSSPAGDAGIPPPPDSGSSPPANHTQGAWIKVVRYSSFLTGAPGSPATPWRASGSQTTALPARAFRQCRSSTSTTSSGKSCGILYFDDPSRFFGKSSPFCDSMNQMVIGLDGTLVQTMRLDYPPPSECTWRVWPGYFR